MRVLAFDTATSATTVALADGDGPTVEARDDPQPGARPNHGRRLLALIEEVLERGGVGWTNVDRLAVGVGPGTFTGLRIGVATAHALSRARAIPLVGVSTLASLALAAAAEAGDRDLSAVLDARRGEVFTAGWPAGAVPGIQPPRLGPVALAPERLAESWPRGLAVGDGAVRFRETLERVGLVVPPEDSALHLVSAGWHCQLARGEAPGAPDAVQPTYLRLPDAEIARRA